jgi:hypothetical protein
MKDEQPFERIGRLFRQIERQRKTRSLDSAKPPGRSAQELIDKGLAIIDELDPIVRETYRDQPEALAEWEEIMQELKEINEDETNER